MNVIQVISLLPQNQREVTAFVEKVESLVEGGIVDKKDLADMLECPQKMIDELNKLTK